MADGSDGGDAACWLDRVCDGCGRFIEDPATHHCDAAVLADDVVSQRASRSPEA